MGHQRVVDHFARHAAAEPDRTAVLCCGKRTTYGELASRVDFIAHVLQKQGVTRGAYVGVMLYRSVDLVASLLAIQAVGAAYVPLDPLYPPDRCAIMVEDSKASALVTVTELASSFASKLEDTVCVIELDDTALLDIAGAEPRPTAVEAREHDIAYAIFTSGSTGRPKGVPIYHSALLNLLESFRGELDATADDVFLSLTTICFDIAGLELYLPFVTGGTLLLATREQASDPTILADLIDASKATIMQATPTTWKMLLRNGWSGAYNLTALCGGEAMPQDMMEDLLPKVGALYNVYGPTETTIWSTCWKCEAGAPIQIGHPLLNTTVHIYNDEMQALPAGEVGSLWIGGAGLTPGYLNRPDLNEGKLVQNPNPPHETIYETGDLASMSPDGKSLFCCGRKDLQIKLRGYRVEVEEIATVLKRHPLVGDCCVDLKAPKDAPEDKQLVAYIVARSSNEIKKLANASSADLDTDKRFLSICQRSLAKIGSILDVDSRSVDGSRAGNDTNDADLEAINMWGTIYDEAYSSQNAANADPSLNFSGYDNSYTPRIPHQIPVVREWVETTCNRIRALKPRRALEMGCGQGMIMLRCARFTPELYIAADLSQFSVDYCRDILEKDARFQMPHVVMDVAGAHEAHKYVDQELDTIVCNGVSMYFPSADYLLSVIRNSIGAVKPGGAFYLGDVRANTLFPHFHASVQLFQAADDLSVDELRDKVRLSVKFEKEFLADHDMFLALRDEIPNIAEVRLDMKRGEHHSEFSKFRYDVTFWREDPDAGPRERETYSLTPYDPKAHGLSELRATLSADAAPELLAIANVPDARTVVDGEVMRLLRSGRGDVQTCGQLRRASEAAAAARKPLEPEALYRLGEELGYHVEMMWSANDACALDVLFVKQAEQFRYETVAVAARRALSQYPPQPVRDWASYTSKSVKVEGIFADGVDAVASASLSDTDSQPSSSTPGDLALQISLAEIREWKSMLRMCVPEYMVPSIYMQVPALPLTNNGKIDRKALPLPSAEDVRGAKPRDPSAFQAPVGETQITLAFMFGDLLHLGDVSADDDFFEAGGHSLLAMQLTTSISKTFGVRLPIAKLAEYSRVDTLADLIDSMRSGDSGAIAMPPTARLDHPQAVPQVQVEMIPVQNLPHSDVTVCRHVSVPMRDGMNLSAKLWLPQGAPPAAAVVEVNPYRKDDSTAEIDALTFPYLAGHGFPCVRVDSRGAGDSEGSLDDEYSKQQIADAAAVVEWASQQTWCSGDVVMLGVSWSGFLAMQVAAIDPAPEALKGIISVCATDRRFEDDMHFQGGALLFENLSWGAWLMHTLTQPPEPELVGEGWLDMWKKRLEMLEPFAPKWLERARDANYWDHGSVTTKLDRIQVPVFAMGGTHGGGYHNSVARMARGCHNAPVQAAVGPWSHNMPHVSPLGPQTGFLQDVVDFVINACGDRAALRRDFSVFSEAPSPDRPLANAAATLVGRWLSFPSIDAAESALKDSKLVLSDDGSLQVGEPSTGGTVATIPCTINDTLDVTTDAELEAKPCVGLAGGRWFTFGAADDMPTDQASEDACALAFDAAPVTADTLMLGQPALDLELVDGATCDGVIVARLCAVAPNGLSQRITWGVLDVGAAAAAGKPLTVEMQYSCYTLPKGYRLRLALSRDYFPLVWPAVRPAALAPLSIRRGKCVLRLRTTPCSTQEIAKALSAASKAVRSTVHVPAGDAFGHKNGKPGRRQVRADPQGGVVVTLESPTADIVLGASHGKGQFSARNGEVYKVVDREGRMQPEHEVSWKTERLIAGEDGSDAWRAECMLRASMVARGDVLLVKHSMQVSCNGEDVMSKDWEHEVRY